MSIVVLVLAIGFAMPALAAERARLESAACVVADGAYRLSFRLSDVFTPEMTQAVDAGVPTTFTFAVRILRDVPGWTDERVAEFAVRRTLHYDSLRQIYTVLLGESGTTLTFKAAHEARERMLVFDALPIATVGALPASGPLYANVRAEMERISLPDFPFDLSYVFFFAPIFEFKTAWTRVDLPLAPAPAAPPATTPVPEAK